MSDLILNWRLFYWHFQIRRNCPWVSLSFNRYHVGRGSPWFERHH